MLKDYDFDAFLSYSRSDEEIVLSVAEGLKEEGVKVWLDQWRVTEGSSISEEIEKGIQRSRVGVFFASRNSISSDWSTFERQSFIFRDPLNKQRRFQIVKLDNCSVPDSIAQFAHFDFRTITKNSISRLAEIILNPHSTKKTILGTEKNYTSDITDEVPHLWLPGGASHNPFYFGSRQSRFVGREADVKLLQEFLESESVLLWTLLLGGAGTGKSRLVLEFLYSLQDVWYAGFINPEHEYRWEDWKPFKPSVFAIDYAARYSPSISNIIFNSAMNSTNYGYPVRFILIERRADDFWIKPLIQYGRRREVVKNLFYNIKLELKPLSDLDSIKIIRYFCEQNGMTLTDDERIKNIVNTKSQYRLPLFSLLIGDALCKGKNVEIYRDHDVLEDYIEREMAYYDYIGITQQDLFLSSLATMTGGFDLEVISENEDIRERKDMFPTVSTYNPEAISAITKMNATERIYPIEHDLIGELFVLNNIAPRHKLDNRAGILRDIAWGINLTKCNEFIERVSKSFPKHPSIRALMLSNIRLPCQAWSWTVALTNSITSLCDDNRVEEALVLYGIIEDSNNRVEESGKLTARLFQGFSASSITKSILSKHGPESAYEFLRTFDVDENIEKSGFSRAPIEQLTDRHWNISPSESFRRYGKKDITTGSNIWFGGSREDKVMMHYLKLDALIAIVEDSLHRTFLGDFLNDVLEDIDLIVSGNRDKKDFHIAHFYFHFLKMIIFEGLMNVSRANDSYIQILENIEAEDFDWDAGKDICSDTFENRYINARHTVINQQPPNVESMLEVLCNIYNHYYCAIARISLLSKHNDNARKYFKKALAEQPECELCKKWCKMLQDEAESA